MKINILDHGLAARTGHHFDYCHTIASHLIEKGVSVNVCAFSGVHPEVESAFRAMGCSFTPKFSRSPYAPLSPGALGHSALDAIARKTAREMESIADADLWLFPTLTADHLLAFSQTSNPPSMVGVVHTAPYSLHSLGGRAWALGCEKAIQRGLRVRVGAIDPLVAEYVQTYSEGLPIANMPIPISGPSRKSYRDRPLTIGFFGHQRPERGIALIPELVRQLLDRGYEVVLHDSRQQFKFDGSDSRLHLRAFVSDLCAEMVDCDIVVCPMDRKSYSQRLSGIAYSAMASGVPVVLAAGTLSAVRALGSGSACIYFEHTVAGILSAIQKLAESYPAYALGAQRGATLFHHQHGIEKFVRMLLAPTT
jgi:hypothetical protein